MTSDPAAREESVPLPITVMSIRPEELSSRQDPAAQIPGQQMCGVGIQALFPEKARRTRIEKERFGE